MFDPTHKVCLTWQLVTALLHGDTSAIVAGELALKTASKFEKCRVGLSFVTVDVIPSHMPLEFTKSIAFLRSMGNGCRVPDTINECPFSGGWTLPNSRRQPTLKPHISQIVWMLDWSESNTSNWILCPKIGERAETSEENHRGKLVIFAGATFPGRSTAHLPPGGGV